MARLPHPGSSAQHLGDILANSITHGVGAVFAVTGAIYLVLRAARGSAWVFVSCVVFAATLVLVYVCSTLYHSMVRTRARHVFHVLDHAAIYLLIAGTYTPFTLVSLRGTVGWILFAIVWTLAIAGVIFKSFAVGKFAVASALVYLSRDGSLWSRCALLLRPSVRTDSSGSARAGSLIRWGSFSSLWTRTRFFHAVWHLFVLAGSAAHYFAILFYVVPRA